MRWVASISCGRLERLFLLLRDIDCVGQLSAFIKSHGLDMQRLDDVDYTAKHIIKQWLHDGEVKIIVSSSPDLQLLQLYENRSA